MTKRIEREKWILYRHTRDFSLLCEVASIMKSYSKADISNEEKRRLNARLKELKLYKERNDSLPLDAINHKINQLSYYMFGYQAKVDGGRRFIFSPLGNLLLKHLDNKELSAKIFVTMLWAVQYQHPHGGTDKSFQLYPFRLIYKLLQDKRLEGRLYSYEVAYNVVFEKECTHDTYESLVSRLLVFRKLDNERLADLFTEDRHAYVNSVYEWDYYVSEFFASAGVLKKSEGEEICRLQHGNTKTFRKVTRSYVEIPEFLTSYISKLEERYPYDSTPLLLQEKDRLQIDVVKEIYSFYPNMLLCELGVSDEMSRLLELPKLIEQYSVNPENETAYLFEEVLESGFNQFYNVEAKRMGGAGHTDIECLYLTKKKKFAVESKSTSNKLLGINAGRLREHLNEIGGEYTIVITPRYVPAAKRDILGSPIVIILASTFAEYIYNCFSHDLRKMDYADFDEIIVERLGTDVSKQISDLTLSMFALKQ